MLGVLRSHTNSAYTTPTTTIYQEYKHSIKSKYKNQKLVFYSIPNKFLKKKLFHKNPFKSSNNASTY
jgi:hypothetical protein